MNTKKKIARGHKTVTRKISEHDKKIVPRIRKMRKVGMTYSEIAYYLTTKGIKPPGTRGGYKGRIWHASTVLRIAQRHNVA